MCPDECSAELRMVSPVSLESRLSRPLEPLRSDLRSLLMDLVPWVFSLVFLAFPSASACRSAGLLFLVCCLVFVCCASF
ncbi:hypothetical protein NPIL_26651 [Nephila pilipes]|uniref:Uncharacterized protein n=1 Tax=Nephila pilipes TaxID=299642 RepID=A0A8X6QQK3_NEPPI|nr:hypothetical protein NPIL_26651 [Nephila pilipes]